MLKTRVIPCLLLKGQGLVKTTKFKDPVYVGDPVNAVKIFNDREADELLLLDITATPEGRGPQFDIIGEIAGEAFMPVGYGGGVNCMEHIQRLFQLGVEKVALNSHAVSNPELVHEAARRYGNQSIVVSMDVRRHLLGGYEVYTHSATRRTRREPAEYARAVEELGAGEIFLNAIDRDGTLQGGDLDLIRKVAGSVSIPVVACGGLGSLAAMREAVERGGASAVAAGSMFVFYGRHRAVLINYPSRAELEQALP